MDMIVVAFVVFVINLPFGYWRANVKRRSFQWFAAIHIPIPFVVALRILSDIGFAPESYPIMIGAFIAGQYLGGILHRRRAARGRQPLSSCLVWDLIKGAIS